ncbi:hypothetical protein [Nocardioides sp. Arc9.136]|uniref:hypothetical protein n=1 Tax=Nocardioides sp. Arc9.136 TaxID=2996826 RepID=UPI0026667118|nr:hypothetical protein [Nocardioides sp. Arc9.136]WKN47828.1 hypothetical protein OSR43_17530 [Nocardioides sp. Arc9.136]
MEPALTTLLDRQHGVVARRQLLALGIDADRVRNQLAAGRWTLATPRVVSTVTGTLTAEQREWSAVLHAGPRSMLGGLTAAARHGLRGWEATEVTVLVDDQLAFEAVDGVRFFRSRRPFDLLRSTRPGIPRCELEPAVLLHAAYVAPVRPAHALVAACVQQRLSTPSRMIEWIDQLRPLRGGRSFSATLSHADAGAHSGAERAVGRLCRRYGMPQPRRQVARVDSAGRRRFTDCEWPLPDGTTLVLEVDGDFHMEVRQYTDDLRRTRRLAGRDRIVVRCTAYELLHEPDDVARDLLALGVPGCVPDAAA